MIDVSTLELVAGLAYMIEWVYMKNRPGKIIAVVGAPSVGKSTFVRHLKDKYRVTAFLEGEEGDLPEFVKENISQNKNRLQTTLYFHNQNIDQYNQALTLKDQAHHVVLDAFWLTNLFFINDIIYNNRAEQDLVRDLIRLANQSLHLPDYIIYLEASDELVKERVLGRGRGFEANVMDSFFKVNQAHINYFNNDAEQELARSNIIRVSAADFDYDKLAKKLNLLKI
mgnify:FL=1